MIRADIWREKLDLEENEGGSARSAEEKRDSTRWFDSPARLLRYVCYITLSPLSLLSAPYPSHLRSAWWTRKASEREEGNAGIGDSGELRGWAPVEGAG